jgi:hypothetical protein
MKKINDLGTLQAEISKLELRQAELEDQLKQQWTGLKQDLRPAGTAATLVNMVFRKEPKTMKGTLLRSALTFGAGLLIDRAGPDWLRILRRKKTKA